MKNRVSGGASANCDRGSARARFGVDFLVAGEMMGAQSGLGFLVIDARNNLRLDILLAAIATIGLTGLALDSAIKVVEKRLLKARETK